MGTNPLVTALFAYFILKSPITKQQMLGIAFALVGVILVLTQGSFEIIRTLSISKGDLLILAGNICWALYGVLGRKYLKGSFFNGDNYLYNDCVRFNNTRPLYEAFSLYLTLRFSLECYLFIGAFIYERIRLPLVE